MMDLKLTDTITIDRSAWVGYENNLHKDKELAEIFDEYVLKTPCISMSFMSEDFIEGMGIKTTSNATALISKLRSDGFNIDFTNSPKEIADAVAQRHAIDENFYTKTEFAHVRYDTPPEIVSKRIRSLRELSPASRVAGIENETEKIVLTEFGKVDAVYRSIRNSLAHGSFKVLEINGQQCLFMHNVNSKNNLTAIMTISTKRLKKWKTFRWQMVNSQKNRREA